MKRIIISEGSVHKLAGMLLSENSMDRALNALMREYFGIKEFNDVRSFLADTIYGQFPDLRYFKNKKAAINVIKFFFRPDGMLTDRDGRLEVFKYIVHDVLEKRPAEMAKIESMLAEDIYNIDDIESKYYPEDSNIMVLGSEKHVETPNGYDVYRIDNFNEMRDWEGIGWCVADDAGFFHGYVGSFGTAYVAEYAGSVNAPDGIMEMYHEFEGKGFKAALSDPRCGKFGSGKFPYDMNGLSTLFVIAFPDGRMDVYSRWNLPEENGRYLTKEQLSQLLGVDADRVCPPLSVVK